MFCRWNKRNQSRKVFSSLQKVACRERVSIVYAYQCGCFCSEGGHMKLHHLSESFVEGLMCTINIPLLRPWRDHSVGSTGRRPRGKSAILLLKGCWDLVSSSILSDQTKCSKYRRIEDAFKIRSLRPHAGGDILCKSWRSHNHRTDYAKPDFKSVHCNVDFLFGLLRRASVSKLVKCNNPRLPLKIVWF